MFPYRCETFTTANVSVLNVSTAIVNTINASSITSDMTIGANLNGGSLTIGSANATVNVSGTINASNLKLYSTTNATTKSAFLDTIGTTLNSQLLLGFSNASEVYLGNSKSKFLQIGGDAGTVNIASTGLSATGKVNIATGTNVYGAEIKIGSSSLTKCGIFAGEVKLDSNNIVIGSALSGNGIIDIAGYADTTTGYLALGSRNLDATYMKAKTIFINHDGGNVIMGTTASGSTNITGNVTLGANALTDPSAASTNITLGTANSVFRLYTPITIGHGMPGSASQLGGQLDHTTIFISDSSPTYTGFAYINAVPTGRYICQAIVYYTGSNPSMWIYTSLAIKSTPMGAYQGGLTPLGDNALETFSTKPNNVDRFSINPSCVYSFTAPNNNVALGVQSGAWSIGLYTRLTLTRIG